MPKFDLRGGEIYLRAGVHWGPNSGFGVNHIWEAHQRELHQSGCLCIDDIPEHIAKMIVPGAAIFCEFMQMDGNHRVAVLKNPTGTLILQPRDDRQGFAYHVITWYAKRRAEGTLVGQIV